MALNVDLLRSSFEAVAPKADELADTFYNTLFERYPDVKPLFANTDLAEQKKKLIGSIALIVKNADNADELVPYLKELGKKHVTYGSKKEHYPAVGECLITALSATAGDLWNQEMEDTWTTAYGVISENMIAGAGYDE